MDVGRDRSTTLRRAQLTSNREQVIQRLVPFVRRELARGVPLNRITRHILGLYHGQPGARLWRRYLSEHSGKNGATAELLLAAAEQLIK